MPRPAVDLTSAGVLAALNELRREPLHERVYLELREALLRGAFEPGQKLPIRVIARALNTSEVPVREALRRLTSERALEIMPNGTAAVHVMTRQKFAGITTVRIALEGLAAELAAANATDADIAAIEKYCAETERLEPEIDRQLKPYLQANQGFHFAIYAAGKNEELLQQIAMLWLRIGPFLNHVASYIVARPDPWHREATDAIRRGDARAARAAIEGDIRDGERQLSQYANLADDD